MKKSIIENKGKSGPSSNNGKNNHSTSLNNALKHNKSTQCIECEVWSHTC